MSLPTLTGVARLVEDPELKYGPSGTAVCKVRLAFNSRKKDDQGNWVDGDSYFVDGTVFRQEAEHVAESLPKGTEVFVTGRLKTRKYQTREGEQRSTTDLVIDSIGPTLKFATARVQKMQRSNGHAGTPAGGNFGDPWATAAPAGRGGGYNSDEPPF